MIFALEARSVNKHYGSFQAIKNLSLQINAGEIFGLLGPNGAGKSTFINMIGGPTLIDSGQIRIFGHDNQQDYIITRSITGLMHQEVLLENFLPIGRVLEYYAGFYGFTDDPKWRKRLIERLELGPHLKKKPNQLSGGTKRRFMAAKALIHKPRLVILDEPTAGVDVELRRSLWSFIRDINREGITVLLTTHYLEEAEEMCERIGILQGGQLVALEKTQNLINAFGQHRLCFIFQEPVTEWPAALNEFQPELSQNKYQLSLKCQNDQLCQVMQMVHQTLPVYKAFEVQKPKLEDVFLHIVQKERT